MTKATFLQQLNWRYAAKKFDSSKKISAEDWSFLEEVLRLSPSSYGLQPWKFFLIENPEVRKQLLTASWGQSQVVDCSHFVVFTTLKKMDEAYVDKYIKSISDIRGVSISTLDGFKKNIVNTWVNKAKPEELLSWTRRQVYIPMGNLMNAAAMIGVDTTPMEGLQPEKYDEILKLQSSEFATVAAVACGYRHPQDPLIQAKKVRFARSEIIQTI